MSTITANPKVRRVAREVGLIAVLYVGYSASRLIASNALAPAIKRATELVHVEQLLGIHWELGLNQLFAEWRVIGLFGSYWYATAHYIVTAYALVWLYRKGSEVYIPARRALVIATLIGLALYLTLPTAPPRLAGGYIDILQLHAADGWWGADASAPRGLGGLTNQLAAFPSLHAGWALWVAIAIQRNASRTWVKVLGWSHAIVTAVVIIGTGNHWVIDAVMGWVVIFTGWAISDAWTRRRHRTENPA